MAKLGIVTTPPIGTPLPDGGGNINSNFDELYTLLGDGNELYPGIVTSITAGSNIAISTSYGNVSIAVSSSAFTETLDTVTDRGNVTTNGIRVGVVTATSFVRNGGTASQFLKADGSVDGNTYLTASSPINLTLDDVTSNGNTTANNISVGSLVALGNVAAGASILAVNAAYASSFRRIGGSSTEFLKGDGSVDTNTYATVAYVDTNAGYWVQDSVGINTASNVGIGTSAGAERLIVQGDARIVGILTVGSASVTIDGDNEVISVGNTVSIGSTAIHVGSGITISEEAIYVGSGITISSVTNQIFIKGEEVIDRWKIGAVGISTTNEVGIGTSAVSDYQLNVLGDSRFTGIVSAIYLFGDGSGITNISGAGDTTGLASIEYVDQKVGLATAGISTAGLASIVYVDEQVAAIGTASTVGLASIEYVDSQVGLATAGLASTSYVDTQVGLATVGLASIVYVDEQVAAIGTASTIGLASIEYVDTQVGLATVGLASEDFVGLSTAGLITNIVGGTDINVVQSSGIATISFDGDIKANVEISDSAPAGANSGDLWWDSTRLTGFIYYTDPANNSQWVEFNAAGGGTGGNSGIGTLNLASITYVNTTVGLATQGLASIDYVDQEIANISVGSTANVVTNSLSVLGVSTFNSNISIGGTIAATDAIYYGKDRTNTIGGGPIHITPDNSATQWSFRIDTADNLNFDAYVGSYAEVIWFQPDGGAHFSGKVELTTGTAAGEATTKGYVDDAISGFATVGYVDLRDAEVLNSVQNNLNTNYYTAGQVDTIVGLATAGITTSGFATIQYVGLATAGLASEGYVDSAVANSVAGFASVSYVDNKVGLSTIGLLNESTVIGIVSTALFDYATEQYVDTAVGLATAGLAREKNRIIVSGVTTSIADLGIGNTDITGFKAYNLMKVGLSTAGWLRLYTDSTSRANDASRSIGIDPTPGSGVIAEVVTTGISTTQIITPFVPGGNLDEPTTDLIYASVMNMSGQTTTISVDLTILQLED